MPEGEACPNCRDNLGFNKYEGRHPKLYRVYMHENLPMGARQWVGVGWYCPHCHYFQADPEPKIKSDFLRRGGW